MPILNPPGAPTGNLVTQDVYSISRYLNDPTFVYRDLATLADQMFVSNKVLRGQFYTDDGSIIYEQIESIYAGATPGAVSPGGEYPLAPIPTGPAQIGTTTKWGLDTIITDESINRQRIDAYQKAMIKLANSMVLQIDGIGMSTIQGAISTQINAGASEMGGSAPAGGAEWSGANARILRDLLFAGQTIRAQKQGYTPDTVLCDLQTFAVIISDPNLAARLPRENLGADGASAMPAMAGLDTLLEAHMAGMRILSSVQFTEPYCAVLDSKVFGAFVDERLPAPGYTGGATGVADSDSAFRSMIQVKSMREDGTDRWRVRARRVTTPIVIEPLAACEIVGI